MDWIDTQTTVDEAAVHIGGKHCIGLHQFCSCMEGILNCHDDTLRGDAPYVPHNCRHSCVIVAREHAECSSAVTVLSPPHHVKSTLKKVTPDDDENSQESMGVPRRSQLRRYQGENRDSVRSL